MRRTGTGRDGTGGAQVTAGGVGGKSGQRRSAQQDDIGRQPRPATQHGREDGQRQQPQPGVRRPGHHGAGGHRAGGTARPSGQGDRPQIPGAVG